MRKVFFDTLMDSFVQCFEDLLDFSRHTDDEFHPVMMNTVRQAIKGTHDYGKRKSCAVHYKLDAPRDLVSACFVYWAIPSRESQIRGLLVHTVIRPTDIFIIFGSCLCES